MTFKINKYRLAIILIVLVGPVLDLLTGYYQLVLGRTSELTPGVIYRGLILTPIFFLLIHKLRGGYFRVVVYYFLFVFLMGMGVHFLSGYKVSVVNHIQRFLKILFPILGFGAIMYLTNRFPRSQSEQFLWKVVGLYGLITVGSIVFLFFIGKGVATYRYGFSFKGFFGSQNSIGFILVTSLSGLLYYIYAYRRNNVFLILSAEALFLLAAFLVGTRAAIIGVPVTIMFFHGFAFFKRGYGQRIPPPVYGFVLLLLFVFVGLLTYRYWSSQYDISFIQRKFEMLVGGGGFTYGTRHFRAKVPYGIEQISKFGLSEHLFGIGDAGFDLTENDLVDIYGKFGLLILVPLILFLARYYLGVLAVFIRRKSLASLVILLSFSFYILHAALAGHALSIAQSNNLFMLMYYLSYRKMCSRRNRHKVLAAKRQLDGKIYA